MTSMFPIKSSILENLYDDDTIYHYTKSSTAIDYILFGQQLKFSKSLHSTDPIESRIARRSTAYYNLPTHIIESNEENENVNFLHNYLEDLETNFYQICFCKNSINDDNKPFKYFEGNEESFGFTKLRMWDQYADKYTGVCIAFSKTKILELNRTNLDLIYNDVKYLSFREIELQKIGDIQGNHLIKVGKEYYQQQLKEQVENSLFLKHQDYSSENEFRIGTFFDNKKTTVDFFRGEPIFNQSIMLNIKDCIKTIFISSFANAKQKEELLNYSNKLKVNLVEIKWNYDSIELIDYKTQIAFFEKFSNP